MSLQQELDEMEQNVPLKSSNPIGVSNINI